MAAHKGEGFHNFFDRKIIKKISSIYLSENPIQSSVEILTFFLIKIMFRKNVKTFFQMI